QPHQHPWRLRSPGVWRWHLGGRARVGDTMRVPEEAAQHAHFGFRYAARRDFLEGLNTRHYPTVGYGRWYGIRHRVRGRARAWPDDGRAHDDVQYEHRVRRSRGHGGARRDDVRISRWPSLCASRRNLGG